MKLRKGLLKAVMSEIWIASWASHVKIRGKSMLNKSTQVDLFNNFYDLNVYGHAHLDLRICLMIPGSESVII